MDFAHYYETICRFESISREEENALFEEYYNEETSSARKKAIREKIINSNLRFVFKTAKHYSKNDLNQFEELICAGNEGLLVGFDKFQPGNGVRFLSYAGWWVWQRILKEMSKFRIVALPLSKQQLSTKIARYVESVEGNVSLDELKEEFPDKSEKDLRELYQTRYLTYFFDDMSEEEDQLHDPIMDILDENIDDGRINRVVESMDHTHRIVLSLLFGLDDGKERSPTEVAKVLRRPRKDIKELKKEALNELKEKLRNF